MSNRLLSHTRPTSILLIAVIAVALACAPLLAGELCMRYSLHAMFKAMVKCMVEDDANVSITTAPPLLIQAVNGHYTDITIATAGNQVRSAKGMRIVVDIKDLRLAGNHASEATIGSLNATMQWSDNGMEQTARQAFPLLGGFFSGVSTDPSTGTIALESELGTVTAQPTLAGGSVHLQIKSLTAPGLALPTYGLQSVLDSFAADVKKELPTGLRADDLKITNSGVAAHFSASNVSIRATERHSCLSGQR